MSAGIFFLYDTKIMKINDNMIVVILIEKACIIVRLFFSMQGGIM